jgi:hypothetical protein
MNAGARVELSTKPPTHATTSLFLYYYYYFFDGFFENCSV